MKRNFGFLLMLLLVGIAAFGPANRARAVMRLTFTAEFNADVFEAKKDSEKTPIVLSGRIVDQKGKVVRGKDLTTGEVYIRCGLIFQKIEDATLPGDILFSEDGFSVKASLTVGVYELVWQTPERIAFWQFRVVDEHNLTVKLAETSFSPRMQDSKLKIRLAGKLLDGDGKGVELKTVHGPDEMISVTNKANGDFVAEVAYYKAPYRTVLAFEAANGGIAKEAVDVAHSRSYHAMRFKKTELSGELKNGRIQVLLQGEFLAKSGAPASAALLKATEVFVATENPKRYVLDGVVENSLELKGHEFSCLVNVLPGDYTLNWSSHEAVASAAFSVKAINPEAEGLIFTVDNPTYLDYGKEKTLEVAPMVVEGGSTLVPVRALEGLGAYVGWVPSKLQATFKLDGILVELTLGSRTAYVNGKQHTMPVAAREFSGRTLVPLRFVGESLGIKVHYDEGTKEIFLRK